MSYSMRFVVTPLPASDDTLFDCIKDAANRAPRTLNSIKSVPVSQIAVGPRHVALLLEDGRIARASYNILADRLEFPAPTPATTNTAQFSNITVSNASHSGIAGLTQTQQQQHRLGVPPGGSQMMSKSSVVSVITSGSMAPSLDGRSGTSNSGSSSTSVIQSPSSSVQNNPTFPGRVNISPQVGGLSVQHRQAARRGRMLRHTASRGRGASVIMGSRAIIPAQYVPEDLINQAQVVLQGKPRSAIVRELQRTNLDVNSAVNNLLSSDNEDPEDMDEREDYLPNEDLMSLLDSSVSLQSGGPTSVLIDAETVFPEDVFNSYSTAASRLRNHTFSHTLTPENVRAGRSNSERESSLASELELRRMASGRDPSQSRRWLEHALRDPANSEVITNSRLSSATPTDFTLHHKNEPNSSSTTNNTRRNSSFAPEINPIHISDTVELWPAGDKKFVQIASMHSELIAISSTGQIHQWKWSEALPFEGVRHGDVINYHPRVAQLNLTHEKVQLLSASCIRASVVTQSCKVATWIDETINTVANKLEHGAQNYPEFQRGDRIAQLQTCSLYTCVRLESGALYWWGVAPFSQRKKNWKKIQSKACKHNSGTSGSSEIAVGSTVCLKNGPSFGDGAIGFTTKDGIPKVGRLTMSAWNITDTCTFKIMQTPERKPSSHSTSSQQSISQPVVFHESKRSRKLLGQPIDFSGNVSDDQTPQSPGVNKNSSSERLEMPPPPSPASSTCSEPGCSPSHKRKHKHSLSVKDDDKLKDEEQWNLKDVIFLEEVKKPPAAKVIKLDGNTALVRFNQRDPFAHQPDSDVNAYLQDCRMIRKEELQLDKETTSSSRIIDCQRSPRRLNIGDSCDFLTFTVSNNGIHALVRNGSKIEYKMYQLSSGKVSKSLFFATDTNAFLGRDPSLITLYACGENDVAVTLRDGNGSLYPLSKDFLDSLREPQPLDMAPIQALSMAVHPLRDPNNPSKTHPTLVMAMALENQMLIPGVLRSDPELVRLTLASLDKEPVSQQIVAAEKIDLNRNILHAAVFSCAPTQTKSNPIDRNPSTRYSDESFEPYQAGSSRTSGVLNDTLKRSRGKMVPNGVSLSNPPSMLDLTSDADKHNQPLFLVNDTSNSLPPNQDNNTDPSSIFSRFDVDPTEQKQSAHAVLLTLVRCPILRPYLKDLMMERDAQAMTPFMSAVSCRAYTAAIILLDLAQWIINQDSNTDPDYRQKLLYSMIFPPGCNLDNNPLYMLCANDTCSFTWTGAQHINQDIFECKTCGLTRTLCCCTECARTCHKGHDCRLKKTSPTAYCDCWEKCKCKSLVAGSHFSRFKLLERLLSDTDLVTYTDSKGESILLFLVQTVGRQMIEQRQYGPHRSSRHNKRDDPSDMPDHDLSPPRFARKALHKMLGEWLALKSVIMAGTSSLQNIANIVRLNPLFNPEDQLLLSGQHGTALLDRFTHSVLIKIGPEMLDVLLTTIIREASSANSNRVLEAKMVAKRFVRSVARNGVVLSVELSPINYSQRMNLSDISNSILNPLSTFGTGLNSGGAGSSGGGPWKPGSQQPASILQKCRKVFQALLPIAAEELAEIADALISPVRLGVPRPTAPFSLVNSMAEATQASEEIFVVEPVVIPTSNTQESDTSAPVMSPPQLIAQRQSVITGPSNAIPSDTLSSATSNEPPTLTESIPIASTSSVDRARDILYDNEIAMDTLDSEDAEATNNTFRRSNNEDTDSDSESNQDDSSFQSNMEPNGARSATTGATAGSEVGASTVAYFSDADSGDSSNADDDEESEANDTEHEPDFIGFSREEFFSFPRRSMVPTGAVGHVESSTAVQTHNHHHSQQHHGHMQQQQQHSQSSQQSAFRTNNLGQQLHWALRSRDHTLYPPPQSAVGSAASIPSTAARLASIGLAGTYTYLDGTPSRRPIIPGNSSQSMNIGSSSNELSMSTTAVGLSRAFSIIIRSISDLIPILKESERLDTSLAINQLKVSPSEAATIISNLEKKLNPVWEWLFKIMDSTEGQLKFGCALTNGIQAVAAAHHGHTTHSSVLNQHQLSIGGRNPVLPGANLSTSTGPSIGQAGVGSVPPPISASSYFPQSSNLLPIHPAMLARANLSAHSLNRRVPNLFVDESVTSRSTSSGSISGSAIGPNNPSGAQSTDSGISGVRLHNPIGQQSSSSGPSASRPQSLATRANLGSSSYVGRMPLSDNSTSESIDGTAARRDFLSYMISLIRGHGNEHHDSLPILDVSSLRHVAYVFDAYIYYLLALNRNKLSKSTDDWNEEDDKELLQMTATGQAQASLGPKHNFFRRSESTFFLDGSISDPFSQPISESLPLAKEPHLLQPNSRREDLFGMPKQNINETSLETMPLQLSLSTPFTSTCPRCTLMRQQHQAKMSAMKNISSSSNNQDLKNIMCPQHKRSEDFKSDMQHTSLLARWRLTVELFGREFLDDVGAEPGSILTDLVSFPMKENRFRKEMERLRNESAPREISLINVDRDKNILIRQTIKELNNTYHTSERNQSRQNQELPLLACSKVKVSFKDEKGEGNGVARSFYTAFCEAVLSSEKPANLDAPLFYQPGLPNFYSPRQGDASPDRLNAFRNVGRIIGICLSQSEICPIQLNRHVIKYILRKPICWHDLAFFDPILYESLRQLVLDAESVTEGMPDSGSLLKSLDLRFSIDLSPEEGGGQVELTTNGRNIEVTPVNVYEYVRRYAIKRMFKSQEKALQAMRQGVSDVLSPCTLDNLTPEDFRLLLNGVGEIKVQTLISYTSFIDDRGTSAGKRNSSVQVDEQLGYFKRWFWSIVEKMDTKDRQDLVYFWTGSPSLPASEEGFQPMPTVSIRPAEDLHLPTSNVCIFRLYIPLYSSKAILKKKLLIAIKEKNFGFI